jgi:FG-GAP-like repeat
MSLATAATTSAAGSAATAAGSARRPWRRLAAGALLGALALAVAAVLALRAAYPGMASGLWNQARYGTWEENANLWACNTYWLEFMQKLRLDEATGRWDFNHTAEAGLDDFEMGRLAFHRGDFARAAALLERHLQRFGESEQGLFWLAMSNMRLAEVQNCLAHLTAPADGGGPGAVAGAAGGVEAAGHAMDGRRMAMGLAGLVETGHPMTDHAAFCSLPLRRPHDLQQPSRRAAWLFARLLDRFDPDPDSARLYRWLLNFCYMTVGGFPAEVPRRFLIQTPFIDAFYGAAAERARQRYGDLRFADRAQEMGVDSLGNGRGVAVEDFENDGRLDLVVASSKLRFFRNVGGRFVDVTEAAGLGGIVQPFTVSAADVDGDGWMDLLVTCPFSHFHLFLNNRDGTFRDAAAASGLLAALPPDAIAASWITAWGDVNNDGKLDLFIANWAFKMPFLHGIMGKPRMDSKLFINNGDGTFHDGTAEFGLAELVHDRFYIGAAFGDYDRDGYEDLLLTSPLRGTSVLLHNVRGRRFEVTDLLPRKEPAFTGSFVDVDQDGRLDIFEAGFGDARTSVEQAVFGVHAADFLTGHSSILLQTPDGRFVDHPEFFGDGRMPMGTMGASYGDLDNDGCPDFYLGTGNPEPWFILPHLMFLGEEVGSRCTGRMVNISMLQGFGNVQKGHGIVFADFDGDGRQDIYSSLGGMWPSDQWTSQLFMNQTKNANSWVKVRLRGRASNRFGVGSMIAVRAHRADGTPIVRTYHMDSKTGFGSAPYLAHIGLERSVAIDGVEVRWLGSGCVWTYPARLRELNLLDEADCLARGANAGPRRGEFDARSSEASKLARRRGAT